MSSYPPDDPDLPGADPSDILLPRIARLTAELIAMLVKRGMSQRAARAQVAAALARMARALWLRPPGI
jgi:hypothetical protein